MPVVSVGSGTVTDVAKHAVFLHDELHDRLPLVFIATANTMVAYTARMAVIAKHGVKRTHKSRLADTLIMDTTILRDAPPESGLAGIGDAAAMYVSFGDWWLGKRFGLGNYVVTILGAGAMGAALTTPALAAGNGVRLWGTWLDDDILAALRAGQPHPRINVPIDQAAGLFDSGDLAAALDGAELVILAISSDGVVEVLRRAAPHLRPGLPLLVTTKGFGYDPDGKVSLLPPLLRAVLPGELADAARSWPSADRARPTRWPPAGRPPRCSAVPTSTWPSAPPTCSALRCTASRLPTTSTGSRPRRR